MKGTDCTLTQLDTRATFSPLPNADNAATPQLADDNLQLNFCDPNRMERVGVPRRAPSRFLAAVIISSRGLLTANNETLRQRRGTPRRPKWNQLHTLLNWKLVRRTQHRAHTRTCARTHEERERATVSRRNSETIYYSRRCNSPIWVWLGSARHGENPEALDCFPAWKVNCECCNCFQLDIAWVKDQMCELIIAKLIYVRECTSCNSHICRQQINNRANKQRGELTKKLSLVNARGVDPVTNFTRQLNEPIKNTCIKPGDTRDQTVHSLIIDTNTVQVNSRLFLLLSRLQLIQLFPLPKRNVVYYVGR